MKFSKKILAAFLAALMVFTMMPFTVFAANVNYSNYGSIENASSGDYISLTKNETVTRLTGTTQIYVKQSCTLNGNGCSFTGNPGTNRANLLYDYTRAKTFNLTNITLSSSGRILNPRINGSVYNADSTVTFTKGASNCAWGGALAELSAGTTLNLNGSTVNGITSNGSGGAFNVGSGTVNLNYTGTNNTIENCGAAGNGGVANIGNNGTMTITDATITNNSANGNGGAIYLAANGTLILKGNTNITGNTASESNNNIYLTSGAVITLDGFTGRAGVTTADVPVSGAPVKIATGATQADETRITSDNNEYEVDFNSADNCLYLKLVEDNIPTGVAEIGGVGYATFEEAIAAAQNGGTITLLQDVTVDSTIVVNDGRHITIELNGHKINSDVRVFEIRHGGVAVTGHGTVETSAVSAVAIYGSTNSDDANYAIFELETDATISAPNGYGAMIGANDKAAYGAVMILDGTINSKYGVYVNGNIEEPADKTNAAEVIIDGTVTADSENAAVYAAGFAEWTIEPGAAITGGSGIYIKSGDLTVNGGTITATGAKTDYVFNSNGANGTGDAIIIDSCGYPGNVPTVAINAGTVTSTNGAAVASYTKQDDPRYPDATFARVDEVIPATSTAVFSSDVSALAEVGYVTEYDAQKGGYVVNKDANVAAIGKVAYPTLEAAFAAAQDGDTVVLLQDAPVASTIAVNDGRNITIDTNGNDITSTVRVFEIRHGGVTLTGDGTVSTTAVSAVAVYGSTNSADADYATFTLDEGTTISAPSGYGAMIGANSKAAYGAKLTIDGTISSLYGVYVNGNVQEPADKTNAAEVTINGTVTAGSENAAAYAAGYAKWTVNDGATVSGGSGIYIKSGDLTVNGGTITANGANTAYAFNPNGANGTGDAVIIDSCGYPGNVPTVAINGGRITSANGEAVASYTKQDDPNYSDANFERVDEVIPGNSTAVFSSDVTDLAEEGYEANYDSAKGGYVVVQDTETEPAYGTAVNCSDAEATITGNATAHTVITLDGATLNFASADPSVGRYYDGYYFTVKFVAPEGTNISQDARYTNGSVDSTTGELKIKNLYTAKDGANFMYSWPYVTPETVQAALEAGVNKEWHYTFDWDGDGIFEQAIDIVIAPTTVKLVKNNEQVYPVVPTDPNNGSAITLEDGVEFNVFIDADAYTGADHVAFTYNHNAAGQTPDVRTDTVDVADATTYTGAGDFNGTKMFDLECAPAQVSEDYTITLYNSYNQVLYTTTYSVAQYCLDTIEYSLTHPEYADAAELCKAVLDYGRAAQLFFNYNTSDIATDSYYNAQVNSLAAADITTAGVNLDGVAVTGVSFDCLSVLNPIIYSTATPSGITVASPVKGNPSAAGVTTGSDANGSYIRVTALESGNINKTLTIATDQGNMQLSSGDICKAIISANADANLVTLARAIYLYGEAANTYFAAH